MTFRDGRFEQLLQLACYPHLSAGLHYDETVDISCNARICLAGWHFLIFWLEVEWGFKFAVEFTLEKAATHVSARTSCTDGRVLVGQG